MPKTDVTDHYERLILEGNDPVKDPEPLRAHMDKWDGKPFIDALELTKDKTVLEIGVGTGRLALRVAGRCRAFTGLDISEKSIARAAAHLAAYPQARLIRADFMAWETQARFDVIYASLTFMHLKDKAAAVRRVAAMLGPGGRAVISLDKDQSGVIDYGTRRLAVWPDDPAAMAAQLRAEGLRVLPAQELPFAFILTAVKGEEA